MCVKRGREGASGRGIIDTANQKVQSACRATKHLGVELPIVGQYRIADLSADTPCKSLGQHLGLEATDVTPVERLTRNVVHLDPIHVDEKELGATPNQQAADCLGQESSGPAT